jgi:NAD(P)-dependent dehydrogenase (short-subunit alcohol dehydrogenase family)
MADTAVVTGAGRGMGREIALGLARRGLAVLCTDVNVAAAQETADVAGNGAWALSHDVSDPAQHRAAAAAARERGPVRAWVNNAGVLRTQKAWEHSDADVVLTVEANLLGVVHGSRAAVDVMGAAGGHIINMGSMSAFGPVPGLAVYAATKHAVLAFTLSLQGDLDAAGLPIRAHCVCPDVVATDMVRERSADADAAILWSSEHLSPADVARRAVALLDSEQLVLAIPRSRQAVARFGLLFPRLGLKLLPLVRRQGERRRARLSVGPARSPWYRSRSRGSG